MAHESIVEHVEHHTVDSSGIAIHYVEMPTKNSSNDRAPLAVMVHGFPESWYSWRHQLVALSDAGYRAIAMDVRGYGQSDSPTSIESYAMMALVGDVVAVIESANATQKDQPTEPAFVIGHDWGAPIAWNTALVRPDLVRGVAGLSVPYNPRGPVRPLEALRALSADQLFYIDYFQEPGLVEAEVAPDLAGWLRGFYFTASAEADLSKPSMGFVDPGQELRERFQQPGPGQMAWMTDDDFAFYLSEFERTGLTGGFNRYRNIDRDWEQLAPWHFAPITVPALFIGGDKDGPTVLGSKAIDGFDRNLPALTKSVVLQDCGHWVQQEKPEATNELILEFLAEVV